MRPAGTRKRYDQRLTAKEKGKIAARIVAGDKQVAVAGEFGICVDTVREIQREFAIPRWRKLTRTIEKEIVTLLIEGIGIHRVVKMSRVPESKVRAIMQQHGIVHESGGRSLPADLRAQIAESIMRREDYCVGLARKFGVSIERVRKIAHEILGPARLLGWPVWPPMSSIFPQSNVDVAKMTEPDQFVAVVQCVLEKSFDGKFPFAPEHDRLFIAAMLVGLQRINPDFDGQPQAVLDNIAMGLTVAVDCLRRERAARWEN